MLATLSLSGGCDAAFSRSRRSAIALSLGVAAVFGRLLLPVLVTGADDDVATPPGVGSGAAVVEGTAVLFAAEDWLLVGESVLLIFPVAVALFADCVDGIFRLS